MNFFEIPLADLMGLFLGFVLTLFIFSYTWGDNPLFRFTTHVFVGVVAGYTLIITIHNAILPHLIFPLLGDNRSEMILAVVFLIPSALLLTKLSPRLSRLGNPSMAMLVGIGAATAVGGSVIGTVFPQVWASTGVIEAHGLVNGGIILLATLSTLIYFHFGKSGKSDQGSNRFQAIRGIGLVGQFFIAVTFGVLFAGVYFAALSALIERFRFLWTFIRDLFLPAILGS